MNLIFLAIFAFSASLAEAKTSCPPGFALVNNNKCLNMISDHYKHKEAELRCTGYGGTLVNIHNAIDNRAVANFAGAAVAQYTWLGIFCFANDVSSCYSDDGSGLVTYTNFVPGHPKVDQGYGGCVYMQTYGPDKGKWFSGPCAVRGLAFVCEVPTTVEDPTCVHNFNGYCYYPSNEIQKLAETDIFTSAEDVCTYYYKSPLASIHTKMEIDFIRSIYQFKNIASVMLGAKVAWPTRDTYNVTWSDGTDFDFDYRDPTDWKDKGDCLMMDLSGRNDSGLWKPTDCSKDTYFLCKKPLLDTVSVNPKFKKVKKIASKPSVINLADESHCNQTLFLAPGVVTSFDYLDKQAPPTFCTWNIAVVGAYRLGVYFTDFSLGDTLFIYDEFGNKLDDPHGTRAPYNVLAPTNIVKMTHNAAFDAEWSYHGFSATILPY